MLHEQLWICFGNPGQPELFYASILWKTIQMGNPHLEAIKIDEMVDSGCFIVQLRVPLNNKQLIMSNF
jgi:hypothetical protein